jgi:hypothetical protein
MAGRLAPSETDILADELAQGAEHARLRLHLQIAQQTFWR